jgi:DNA-binding SARP family transcriptional activator
MPSGRVIHCRVLGPVEVSVDGRKPPKALLWRHNVGLLVYLARSPTRGRTREHLTGLLWPEKPEQKSQRSLAVALSQLRRMVGSDGLDTSGGQVRLAPGSIELDVDRLEAQAQVGEWSAGAALVSGEFMEGFAIKGASAFEDWLTAERAAWNRRCVEVLSRHAEQLLGAGDATAALAAARRALLLDPVSARAMRVLMRTLALTGDRPGALTEFTAFAERLQATVAVAPDAETAGLAERIRRERTWRVSGQRRAGVESRRAPLIGRGAALGSLWDAWRRGRETGRAVLLLVAGDAGVGKTRLLEELLGRIRLDGGATALIRAVEADVGTPWSGVWGLAQGLVDAPGVAAAPAPALATFAQRLSEWGDRFRADTASAPLSPGDALRAVTRAIVDEGPLALVVDDAQWFDHESLLCLAAALRDVARHPLAVIVTMPARPARAELDELLARIGRDVEGVAVRLQPLTAADLRQLAEWAFPAYQPEQLDRLTRRMLADSAGLPLLAVELLHAVALGLDLDRTRGVWPQPQHTLDQTLPSQLPESTVGALRTSFNRLSQPAQRVLATAAALDERILPEQVLRVTQLDAATLDALLDELEWHRWLVSEGRGYTFLARVVQEIIARDQLRAGERERIRAAAGLA